MFVTFKVRGGHTAHVRADRVVWVSSNEVMVDDGTGNAFTLADGEDETRIVRDVQAALVFRAEAPAGVNPGRLRADLERYCTGLQRHLLTPSTTEPTDGGCGPSKLVVRATDPVTVPLATGGDVTARVVEVAPADSWTGPPVVHDEGPPGTAPDHPTGPAQCLRDTADAYRRGPCVLPAGHVGPCRPPGGGTVP